MRQMLAGWFLGMVTMALVVVNLGAKDEMPHEWYSVKMADTNPRSPTIHVKRQGEADYLFTIKLEPQDHLDKDKETRKEISYTTKVRVHAYKFGFEKRHIGNASMTQPHDGIEWDPR